MPKIRTVPEGEFRNLYARFLELFSDDADELQRSQAASDEVMAVVTVYAAIVIAALSMKNISKLTGPDLKSEFLALCADIFGEQTQ